MTVREKYIAPICAVIIQWSHIGSCLTRLVGSIRAQHVETVRGGCARFGGPLGGHFNDIEVAQIVPVKMLPVWSRTDRVRCRTGGRVTGTNEHGGRTKIVVLHEVPGESRES